MTTQASLGQTALENRDYPTAIEQLTKALATNPDHPSPLWLIYRSMAYQRSNEHELALDDANAAVHAAIKRARRELIAKAHMRRAIALHGLKRYGDARMCLTWCRKANEKEKALTTWQAKVTLDYDRAERLLGKDAKEVLVTVKEIPDQADSSKPQVRKDTSVAKESPAPQSVASTVTQTPKDKIRHDWYQSSAKVTVTIMAKGVPKDQAKIMIEEESLAISFPILESADSYSIAFTPLFSKVDTSQSTFSITPNKIEVILHKAMQGLKWSAVGTLGNGAPGSAPVKVAAKVESISNSKENTAPTRITESATASTESTEKKPKGPAYPTSSRNGPKDWDAIGSTTEKDDEDGTDINSFFQQLYSKADPDTQKAMMKSYMESNGTSLSTNWAEVSQGPVPTQPPEGVEAKKWNS